MPRFDFKISALFSHACTQGSRAHHVAHIQLSLLPTPILTITYNTEYYHDYCYYYYYCAWNKYGMCVKERWYRFAFAVLYTHERKPNNYSTHRSVSPLYLYTLLRINEFIDIVHRSGAWVDSTCWVWSSLYRITTVRSCCNRSIHSSRLSRIRIQYTVSKVYYKKRQVYRIKYRMNLRFEAISRVRIFHSLALSINSRVSANFHSYSLFHRIWIFD